MVVGLSLMGMLCSCTPSNKGAASTCADFRGYSSSGQNKAVDALLSSKGKSVTPFEQGLTKASVTGYCDLNPGTAAISGIYGG